jgi:hypothetical protein
MQSTRRVIIHVGTGKTGTTSLQNFLANNEDRLAARSHRYAQSYCVGENHHQLCAGYLRRYADISLLNRGYELLTDELLSHKHHFVISSENFLSNTAEDFGTMRRLLEPHGEIHAVLYFRRQDTYVEAWFNQVVKSGRYGTNLNRLYRQLKWKRLLDYQHVAGRLKALCHKSNIHVRSYDYSNKLAGGVVSDFLSCIGIPSAQQQALEGAQTALNSSLSAVSILLLQLISSRLGKDQADVFRAKPPEWFPLPGKGSVFSAAERAIIVHAHARNNREMVEEFCPEHEKFFNPLNPADLETSSPPISADELEEWFARATEHLNI